MNTKKKEVEMVYGIYYGKKFDGNYVGPDGNRQASCVIGENQSDKDIVGNLVAADFLSPWNSYIVIDNGPSIHIFHKEGALALCLMYEEDLE